MRGKYTYKIMLPQYPSAGLLLSNFYSQCPYEIALMKKSLYLLIAEDFWMSSWKTFYSISRLWNGRKIEKWPKFKGLVYRWVEIMLLSHLGHLDLNSIYNLGFSWFYFFFFLEKDAWPQNDFLGNFCSFFKG